MSREALWALLALGFAIVVVRRRTHGVALVAAQSVLLGAVAVSVALGEQGHSLLLAVAILAARGVALPLLLLAVVRSTREPNRIRSERFALSRLVVAVAAVGAAAALVPSFGLGEPGAEPFAAGLLVLGIVIAALRLAVVFQIIGFLVAENGVYLAGVAVAGGVPGAIEIALLFDLVVVLAVAAAFGAKIHEQFGSSDTHLLRGLRD